MTGGSKIIGMWRDKADEPLVEASEVEGEEENSPSELASEESEYVTENIDFEGDGEADEWKYYADEEPVESTLKQYAVPALALFGALLWTGFFLWANRDIFATIPTLKSGIDLITQWCLPLATLGVAYLLYMRNSSKEASRFNDVAQSLRTESDQLETRLKTVNNELSIAREFLMQETKELEFFGQQSSQKLQTAAGAIKTSLADGLTKMNKLGDVSDAAYKNLEQLREHLPVVINTAKDVTNQIGNSGRTAQTEMAAMVTTLKRIGEVGTAAKQSINDLTKGSDESLGKLSETADQIAERLNKQLEETETGTEKIAALLKSSSAEVIESLKQAQISLAQETSETSTAIKGDLDSFETALKALGETADDEETRLKALVDELHQSIADVSIKVAGLDNESGEKTAKLAFGIAALEENCNSMQNSLKVGHGVADGMIERMEKLLTALDSSARELDETLPAAFERVTAKTEESLTTYRQITNEAQKAGEAAEGVAASVRQADEAIAAQGQNLKRLQDDGLATTQTTLDKIDELAKSLAEVREQNEMLAESSGEKLIGALLRVKETANQASEYTREALENSITGSAQTFERVSEEALSRIIDEKISSIAPKLEAAVASAVATTQSTAGQLTEQLKAIEDMTADLEQRILFAKEKAEQSSDENFTRRVAMLTESLNSTAIDVNKILSNEVTDTEWAAYLKGDRGIFTRRAVRLLDSGEVREILTEYDANSEFREHVNRYIHDFEAMLRGVLATRDGSAISVTLLSSDIGKLYVALAQAIERLRG